MRCSGCSGCRRRTRTIPSGRSAPRSGSRGRGRAAGARRQRPAPPGRDQHRRGARPARRGPGLGRAVPRRRHDQHRVPDPVGRAGDGRRRRSRDVRGDEGRLRVRGAPARDPQGQGRAGPRLPREGLARAPGRRPHPDARGPYVGREIDLALLKGLFDKSVAASSVQLVTVVGEPGIGKSRIVAELLAHAQIARPALDLAPGPLPAVRRRGDVLGPGRDRQGARRDPRDRRSRSRRCQDRRRGPRRARTATGSASASGRSSASMPRRRRARGAVHGLADVPRDRRRAHPDGPRVRGHPLGGRRDARVPRAPRRPGRGCPVARSSATARPELFERHATFAAGLPNVNRINLAPLSDAETGAARRAGSSAPSCPRCSGPDPRAGRGQPPLRRGVRPAAPDRDLLVETDGAVALRPGAEVPLPESIGALIAARLDTLPAERKAMLADAAVVGKVFWAGAVAAMGDRDLVEVTEAMRELARKELVRPARRSSMAGEAEYAFWHVLTRDVAYAPAPASVAGGRHVAAATWIEVEGRRAGRGHRRRPRPPLRDRPRARSAAGHAERGGSARRARAPVPESLAGERALGLDIAAALADLRARACPRPAGHPARAEVLLGLAAAAISVARFVEAKEALEDALALARERGDAAAESTALRILADVAFRLGDNARRGELVAEALAVLETLPLASSSSRRSPRRAPLTACRAIPKPDSTSPSARSRWPSSSTRAEHTTRGHSPGARSHAQQLGDERCLADYRLAIMLANQAGSGFTGSLELPQPGAALPLFEGPAEPSRSHGRGSPSLRRGDSSLLATWMRLGSLDNLVDAGRARRSPRRGDGLHQRLQGDDDVVDLVWARDSADANPRLARTGQPGCCTLDWLESRVRGLLQPQYIVSGLGAPPSLAPRSDRTITSSALLTEIEAYPGARNDATYVPLLPGDGANRARDRQPRTRRTARADVEARTPYAEHAHVAANAALAEAHGHHQTAANAYADAARRWGAFGVITEQAFALLGEGRCLLALGNPTRLIRSSARRAASSSGSARPRRSPRSTRCSRRSADGARCRRALGRERCRLQTSTRARARPLPERGTRRGVAQW